MTRKKLQLPAGPSVLVADKALGEARLGWLVRRTPLTDCCQPGGDAGCGRCKANEILRREWPAERANPFPAAEPGAFVEAAAVADFVEHLAQAEGVTVREIAAAAGVKDTKVVAPLTRGRHAKLPPVVRGSVAEALLSLAGTGRPGNAPVDSTAAAERVAEIHALGYSFGWIAEQAGIPVNSVKNLVRRNRARTILARTAHALLSVPVPDQPAPSGLRASRRGLVGEGQAFYTVADSAVKDLVRRLEAAGWTRGGIARTAGFEKAVIGRIMNDKKVTTSSVEKLRRLDPREAPAGGDYGAQRRVRALMRIGHGREAIAAALGVHPSVVELLVGEDLRRPIDPALRSAIAELYDSTPLEPGPDQAAIDRATRAGWPSPLAWDDDRIDEPHARARTGRSYIRQDDPEVLWSQVFACAAGEIGRQHLTEAEQDAVVLMLADDGVSDARIAARLRANQTQVTQRREAAGKRRDEAIEEAIRRREPVGEIARRLNCSVRDVQRVMRGDLVLAG